MSKNGRGRIWWWLVVVAVLAGLLGYFLRTEVAHHESEKPLVSKEPSVPEEASTPSGEKENVQSPLEGKEKTSETQVREGIAPEKPVTETVEDECTRTRKDLVGFFHYLDQKTYMKQFASHGDTFTRFKEILHELKTRPPLPSGEGVDPRMLVGNVYYFFRNVNRGDLQMIREVMRHEQDSMESDFELFYRWLVPGDKCPESEKLRPSLGVLYRFAGFFMNTIGGRAYLSRRPQRVRLLVSYYSILTLYRADKAGENTYGIDIPRLIGPLINEISDYPGFESREEYVSRLTEIEKYYAEKR